mmetsp:Transcript_43410/g.50846  ORF Transcript_43410/g.50846 Transcript_43410/m.50846 type:complete len:92 (-) Transcript_43410:103-378(-)
MKFGMVWLFCFVSGLSFRWKNDLLSQNSKHQSVGKSIGVGSKSQHVTILKSVIDGGGMFAVGTIRGWSLLVMMFQESFFLLRQCKTLMKHP